MIDTSPAVSPDERLLSPKELAERWGLSEQTLANQRSTGCGPRYIRVGRKPSARRGGRVRYLWSAVRDFERAGFRDPGAEAAAA